MGIVPLRMESHIVGTFWFCALHFFSHTTPKPQHAANNEMQYIFLENNFILIYGPVDC